MQLKSARFGVFLAALCGLNLACSGALGPHEGQANGGRPSAGEDGDGVSNSEGDNDEGADNGSNSPGSNPADGPGSETGNEPGQAGGTDSPDGTTPGQPTDPNDPTPGGTTPNPGGTQAGTVAPTFTCDASAAPDSAGWKRLTRVQYENTVRGLLEFALGDMQSVAETYTEISADLSSLPDDERPKLSEDLKGTFRRLDQGVAQTHVDQWYEIGVKLGAVLTREGTLTRVVGECATDDSAVDSCLSDFVQRFGARTLRRPLADDEVSSFAAFYGDTSSADPAGYADVIAGLLNAPQFLYLVEHGADATPDHANVYTLDAFELASRLSYHFWDAPPDDELWQVAADGSLLDAAELERQTQRLIDDPRAEAAMRNFFREWLKLENLAQLDQANEQPVFRTFAGDDAPSALLRDNMINEVLDLLDVITTREERSFDALFSTQLLLPKTADLAQIYGVEANDSAFEAPNADRPGLFTRAAFLATGSATTRPIQKGVFLRQNILCDVIPPPPAAAAAATPPLDPELTTRQVVEALTQAEGTACKGCHQVYINPLGFATENYDALGRVRSEQALFDDDGNVVGNAQIDTTGTPLVNAGDTTTIASAADLMQLILSSGKAHACLARQYFRYSFGRWESLSQDGCELERLREGLAETGSISGMLQAVALSPEFRQRTIEQ